MLEVVYKGFLEGLCVGVSQQLKLKERYLVLPWGLDVEALLGTQDYSLWAHPCQILSVGHQVEQGHLGGCFVLIELEDFEVERYFKFAVELKIVWDLLQVSILWVQVRLIVRAVAHVELHIQLKIEIVLQIHQVSIG